MRASRRSGPSTAAGVARTSVGDIAYDFLLVAVGAFPYAAVPGALMFRGPADSDKVESLVKEMAAADVRRVAFVRPAEVEPLEAVFACPADRLHEEQVVRALWKQARVRGAVLVDECPVGGQEHGRGSGNAAVADKSNKPETLREEVLKGHDEAAWLRRHPLALARPHVKVKELGKGTAIGP